MPDPYTAREFKWLPFMKDVLGADERSVRSAVALRSVSPVTRALLLPCCCAAQIVVGHSSGAAAGVRYAEDNRLAGLILVSAYHTDQGDSNEARSGYFSRPWHFDRAAANCGFVDVFGSNEDPFLALEEQKTVAHGLGVPLRGYPGRGHFMERTFPELLQLVLDRIKGASPADAPVMYAPEGDDK